MKILFSTLCLCFALSTKATASQQRIEGPPGSGAFGHSVTLLSNGYFVITDPEFDLPGVQNVGAAYLYSADGILISRLTGSETNDRVGNQVFALSNGHFVVHSNAWRNGRGAATWGSATRGVDGVVSPVNSLVGTVANGGFYLQPLRNGNYVVASQNWGTETQPSLGAVTWCDGASGMTIGVISTANSLVGTQSYDMVGAFFSRGSPIVELSNGNFLVTSAFWANGDQQYAGAVTWVDGTKGLVGAVSAANSLVGSYYFDAVGEGGITLLPNGNYVVSSPGLDRYMPNQVPDVGAVTWGNGTVGVAGAVSVHNSLVGSHPFDQVGTDWHREYMGVTTVLSNGNYVVKRASEDIQSSHGDLNPRKLSSLAQSPTSQITGYLKLRHPQPLARRRFLAHAVSDFDQIPCKTNAIKRALLKLRGQINQIFQLGHHAPVAIADPFNLRGPMLWVKS